ncbi:MAG: hypothetical protein EON92_00075 [Burkholderiales bacterium]|nr:MAG: hypothetical protein EON92_00075 [Burkholderiales bacterium]
MSAPEQVRQAAASAVNALQALSGVVAVVVATADGFDIASHLNRGIDASRIAAMASSISAIGAVVGQEGKLGTCRHVTIGTTDGFVHLCTVPRADGDLVVNVIADGGAILAMVAYSTAEQVRILAAA